MGDIVEDIIAEPEEPSFFSTLISYIHYIPTFIAANGWYLLAAGAVAYYVWTKHVPRVSGSSSANRNLSPEEIKQFQSKEEARRRYVEQLQEKLNRDSAEKAERDRIKEEEKRKARIEELEKLTNSGKKFGTTNEPGTSSNPKSTRSTPSKKSSTPSLRPEYNPLMGDTSSSRPCSRPSGGRSGG